MRVAFAVTYVSGNGSMANSADPAGTPYGSTSFAQMYWKY